jgi:hypothetical protein
MACSTVNFTFFILNNCKTWLILTARFPVFEDVFVSYAPVCEPQENIFGAFKYAQVKR